MSDFWAERLRGTAPSAPATPQAAPGRPWWDLPTYQSAAVPVPFPEAPPGPQSLHPLTAMPLPTRAMSAKQHSDCPSCGGTNYYRPTPKSAARCFECNYVDGGSYQNQLAGMASIQDNRAAPGKPALGQSKSAGFRPDVIVGHGL